MDDTNDKVEHMSSEFSPSIATGFSLILMMLGLLCFFRLNRRNAVDVLGDLQEGKQIISSSKDSESLKATSKREELLSQEYAFFGVLTSSERAELRRKQLFQVLVGLSLGLIFGILVLRFAPVPTLLSCLCGLCLGYLSSQRKLRTLEERFMKEIVFFLPVVMERVVMAVQSGLDILPALKVIEEIEHPQSQSNQSRRDVDVVTRLLGRVVKLNESGLSFEKSLREVAASVKSNALRHSFIHLAVAQKEGGELIYPLRELSDATQLYYQENIEEEIAKMPIKATMPLLLTFAGLIISFMTGPVVQILNISANPKMASSQTQIERTQEVSGDSQAAK